MGWWILHKEIHRYLDEIFPDKAKGLSSIREEFLTHLEDSALAYQEQGYSEEDAVKQAIKCFGDSKELQAHVQQIQVRRRFRIHLNLMFIFLGVFCISLLYAIKLIDGYSPLTFNPWYIVKITQVSSFLGVVFFFAKCRILRKRMF